MRRTRLDNWICSVEGLSELSPQALSALQLEKLNALLERERRRGGFYSSLPRRLDSLEQLSALRGCDAHSSVILSPADSVTYSKLGMHLTCEPQYETNKLYHR